MLPARRWLTSVSGPGSNARRLRNRMSLAVIHDVASSEAVASNKAPGARAPRELLAGLGGRDRS